MTRRAGSNARQLDRTLGALADPTRRRVVELLAKVTGLRLALVEVRGGETWPQLGSRSGNAWNAAETAAWNARSGATALRAGDWIKIAHSVPWTPAAGK